MCLAGQWDGREEGGEKESVGRRGKVGGKDYFLRLLEEDRGRTETDEFLLKVLEASNCKVY